MVLTMKGSPVDAHLIVYDPPLSILLECVLSMIAREGASITRKDGENAFSFPVISVTLT